MASVLVVDDDEDHATMLELSLEQLGYDVVAAHSVAEAQRVLATRPMDALVADISLGDGTCFDVKPRPRVALVLSGSESSDDLERVRREGFVAHLLKPTTAHEIARVLDEALARA